MHCVADLHLHSRFSRATSPRMVLPELARAAAAKGITLLGTGDFTHPEWLATLSEELVPAGDGVYQCDGAHFILTGEISLVWKQEGRGRRVHLLVLAPSLEAAARIQKVLGVRANLLSDGRPILGMSAMDCVELIWTAEPRAMVIPAHVWTPWYAVFGAKSGFDSLEACFGEHTRRIAALETGLSSDPAMNRRVSVHDRLALVSFSDAHSPEMLGREATLLDLEEISYASIVEALSGGAGLTGTIEFYPEQGKYHADGHRKCGIVREPRAADPSDSACPVCGKRLTIGVLHRVLDLADRTEEQAVAAVRRASWHLVPLRQIIAQALGFGENTKRVAAAYDEVVDRCGNELSALLEIPVDVLRERVPNRIADGIDKARRGELCIKPGHDGVYGRVAIRFDGP